MVAPNSVQDRIARVLKDEMKAGSTTKRDIVAKAMASVGKGNDYGLPRSDLLMAARSIYANEADRQLKRGLPDNVIRFALPNAPPELIQVLPKLPAWIATSEGMDARWVPSLQATAEEWRANAALKMKIANRTRLKARVSTDIADYLSRYGLHSLAETMPSEAAE